MRERRSPDRGFAAYRSSISQPKRDCSQSIFPLEQYNYEPHAFKRKNILVFSHIYNEEYTLNVVTSALLLRAIFPFGPFEQEFQTTGVL